MTSREDTRVTQSYLTAVLFPVAKFASLLGGFLSFIMLIRLMQ